jgi:hypothetical protein
MGIIVRIWRSVRSVMSREKVVSILGARNYEVDEGFASWIRQSVNLVATFYFAMMIMIMSRVF